MIDFKFYLITDRHLCPGRSLEETLMQACAAGVRAVQIREKDLNPTELFVLALRLKSSLAKSGARIFINTRLDIAKMAGLAGVHIPAAGASSLLKTVDESLLVGVSTHNLEEVERAYKAGADFVVFGPVYETPSKAVYGSAVGLQALKQAAERCKIPVFALGGVTPSRVKECLQAGAYGVAVISAVMTAPNIEQAVREFKTELGTL